MSRRGAGDSFLGGVLTLALLLALTYALGERHLCNQTDHEVVDDTGAYP